MGPNDGGNRGINDRGYMFMSQVLRFLGAGHRLQVATGRCDDQVLRRSDHGQLNFAHKYPCGTNHLTIWHVSVIFLLVSCLSNLFNDGIFFNVCCHVITGWVLGNGVTVLWFCWCCWQRFPFCPHTGMNTAGVTLQ